MGVIVSGIVLLLAGLGLLFGMTARFIEPGFGISLLAYAISFSGILLGVFGIARRMNARR